MLKWSDEIWVTWVVLPTFFFAGIFIRYSPVKTSMLELREDRFIPDAASLSTLACRLGRADPGRDIVTVWSGSIVSFCDSERALLPPPRPEALLPRGSVTLTVACSVTFLGTSTSLKVISVLEAFAVNVLISWVDFSILNSFEVVVCFDTEDSEDADVVVLCLFRDVCEFLVLLDIFK